MEPPYCQEPFERSDGVADELPPAVTSLPDGAPADIGSALDVDL